MKQALFFTYMSFLFLSVIAAIIYRKNLIKYGLTLMVPYLSLVFVMEVCLAWYGYKYPFRSNVVVYNIYRPVSVIFFAWIYYFIPFMQRFRQLIISITTVYLFVIVISYTFINSIFSYNIYITLARGFCITFFAIFFLLGFFLLDNRDEEKFWQPLMLITLGVLIFYPLISISIGFQEYLRDYDATIFGLKLYQAVPQVMSIFMYSCFTYAFYLCKKRS